MRVQLLGGFAVEGVAERDLGSRKGRTLLKLLVLGRGTAVSIDRLADVLWGDHQPSRPADQVGVLVSRLRGVLGAGRIRRTDAGYVLFTDWVDVDELDGLAAAAAAPTAASGRHGRRPVPRSPSSAARCSPARKVPGSRPSAPPSAPLCPAPGGSP